ncbi:hypothetical protein EVG20_g9685 [Dentipellis fragilis]|uniref:G-patch domain-containing protein n=1 Tax=Dentipellis fragilis TaxID=205917 RepID=A0A4Y9XXH7_9AGAM|nr:hypothetical protein EVG20_g9685 [Dentipellis fragilis]
MEEKHKDFAASWDSLEKYNSRGWCEMPSEGVVRKLQGLQHRMAVFSADQPPFEGELKVLLARLPAGDAKLGGGAAALRLRESEDESCLWRLRCDDEVSECLEVLSVPGDDEVYWLLKTPERSHSQPPCRPQRPARPSPSPSAARRPFLARPLLAQNQTRPHSRFPPSRGIWRATPLRLAARSLPTPKRRHDDSSEEEDEDQDELVTGFDQFGVQRHLCGSVATSWIGICVAVMRFECQITRSYEPPHGHIAPRAAFLSLSSGPQLTKARARGTLFLCRLQEKKKPQGPLVIAPLQNRDWRELARRRRNWPSYVPPGGAAGVGADGSVGGLGTRDTINSGLEIKGLQVRTKRVKVEVEADAAGFEVKEEVTEVVKEEVTEVVKEELTEDERAMRALLAGGMEDGGPVIDVIRSAANEARRPATEDDAFKQDVEELPDVATLDDYERVPVAQFGAALLRGMGWKEGQAANKKGRGPVEPWLPQARPALLGIGAKEREVLDDGSGKKNKAVRPEKRYVPVIRKEGEGSEGRSRRPSRSPDRTARSRRTSRSRSPARESSRKNKGKDAERERDRDRREQRERDGDGRRDRRRDERRGSYEHDRERDRRIERSPSRSTSRRH